MHMHIHLGIGTVHYMKDDITVACLFQGTFKCFYQMVGQFVDKTNGICKKVLLSVSQCKTAGRWVQRSKKFILCQDPRSSKTI